MPSARWHAWQFSRYRSAPEIATGVSKLSANRAALRRRIVRVRTVPSRPPAEVRLANIDAERVQPAWSGHRRHGRGCRLSGPDVLAQADQRRAGRAPSVSFACHPPCRNSGGGFSCASRKTRAIRRFHGARPCSCDCHARHLVRVGGIGVGRGRISGMAEVLRHSGGGVGISRAPREFSQLRRCGKGLATGDGHDLAPVRGLLRLCRTGARRNRVS